MPYPSYKFVGAKFLGSGNLLSDSYTFVCTLTRLTIYICITVGCQSTRLLVDDIVNLVTMSLLNVLVTIIRFVLEPIGFACVTVPIHLSSCCNQYTSSRNRD